MCVCVCVCVRVCVWRGCLHMWLWISSYVRVCGEVSEYVVEGLQFCLCKCLWCVLYVGGKMSVYMGLCVRGWPLCGCAHEFVCQCLLSSCLSIYVKLIDAHSHKTHRQCSCTSFARLCTVKPYTLADMQTHELTSTHFGFCGYYWLTKGVGFHGENLNKSSG